MHSRVYLCEYNHRIWLFDVIIAKKIAKGFFFSIHNWNPGNVCRVGEQSGVPDFGVSEMEEFLRNETTKCPY